jgi:exonuclease V gamma subunit
VFDTRTDGKTRIPFTIVDQSARRESRLIDVFMSILDLKNSRLGVTTVFAGDKRAIQTNPIGC